MKRERWTPNQLVAYNLRRARGGLTQEEAAKMIAPYLGKEWSVATFSAAERSVRDPSATGQRIRQFTADELLAFAKAFRLPVAYFLTPPPDRTIQVETDAQPLTPAEVLEGAYGTVAGMQVVAGRVRELFDRLGEDELTPKQREAFGTLNEVLAYGLARELARAEEWVRSLRQLPQLADALERVLSKYPRLTDGEEQP